jgi:hypothetical protein
MPAEQAKHTPGPWEYVPSSEHHGPYVTSEFGSTICDCYVMSRPDLPATRNGGESRPIPFLHEMADPNARLIAAAPDLLAALIEMKDFARGYLSEMDEGEVEALKRAVAAIAKAEGN